MYLPAIDYEFVHFLGYFFSHQIAINIFRERERETKDSHCGGNNKHLFHIS